MVPGAWELVMVSTEIRESGIGFMGREKMLGF